MFAINGAGLDAPLTQMGRSTDAGSAVVDAIRHPRPGAGCRLAGGTGETSMSPTHGPGARPPVDHLALDQWLREDGGTVVLRFAPGPPEAVNTDSGVTGVPVGPGYLATAHSRDGDEIGWGAGDTVDVAMRRLRLGATAENAPTPEPDHGEPQLPG
ncbi:hypothetical protein [Nocardia sp. CA-120079]|uniref:hypothetical protein n=1 Tax=Nocardia sp. CA-120079 TaxID=3239974 RepID=UPI003D98A208